MPRAPLPRAHLGRDGDRQHLPGSATSSASVRTTSASFWPLNEAGQAKINTHLASIAALRSPLREEAVSASAGSSLPRAGSREGHVAPHPPGGAEAVGGGLQPAPGDGETQPGRGQKGRRAQWRWVCARASQPCPVEPGKRRGCSAGECAAAGSQGSGVEMGVDEEAARREMFVFLLLLHPSKPLHPPALVAGSESCMPGWGWDGRSRGPHRKPYKNPLPQPWIGSHVPVLPRTHTGLCSAGSKEQSAATALGWGAGCVPLHGAGAGARPQRSQLHPPGCGQAGTLGRDLTRDGSHGGGTTGTARGHGGGTAPDLRDTTSPAKTAVSPGSAQHPAAGSGLLAQSSPLPASLPAAPAAPARS